MAKRINRLTAISVKRLSVKGLYPDGQGLYLQVSPTHTKSWVYRYQINKKERRHGLGTYPIITLEVARKEANYCAQLRVQGYDPIEYKKQVKHKRHLDNSKNITFMECAIAYIDSHKAGWKNPKHEKQWLNTLKTYADPFIGKISVQDIDTTLVMKVLEPIWYIKTETATRIRQRIESVLDWAKVRKYRTGENPALWRGHLDQLLPKRAKVQKVKHYPAMPYADLPNYFNNLRKIETIAAKALAFTILTSTRTNETCQAKWSEIDLDKGIWEIPEIRMKMDKVHRIPLTTECLTILKEMTLFKINAFVFPGLKENKSISDAAVLKLLKQTYPDLTVHGFRSTFRDWCAEITNFSSDLAEAALAHSVGNQVQAAYERGDKFEKRRTLMIAWSDYAKENKTITLVA